MMVAEVIYEFAQERDEEKTHPKLCNGQYPAGSFAITEPHTGSGCGQYPDERPFARKTLMSLMGRRPSSPAESALGVNSHLGGNSIEMAKKGKGISDSSC